MVNYHGFYGRKISVFLIVMLVIISAFAVLNSSAASSSKTYTITAEYYVKGLYKGEKVNGKIVCEGKIKVSIVNINEEKARVTLRSEKEKLIKCETKGDFGELNASEIKNDIIDDIYYMFGLSGEKDSNKFNVSYYGSTLFTPPALMKKIGENEFSSYDKDYSVYEISNKTGELVKYKYYVEKTRSVYSKDSGLLKYYAASGSYKYVDREKDTSLVFTRKMEVKSGFVLPPFNLIELILIVLVIVFVIVSIYEFIQIQKLKKLQKPQPELPTSGPGTGLQPSQ